MVCPVSPPHWSHDPSADWADVSGVSWSNNNTVDPPHASFLLATFSLYTTTGTEVEASFNDVAKYRMHHPGLVWLLLLFCIGNRVFIVNDDWLDHLCLAGTNEHSSGHDNSKYFDPESQLPKYRRWRRNTSGLSWDNGVKEWWTGDWDWETEGFRSKGIRADSGNNHLHVFLVIIFHKSAFTQIIISQPQCQSKAPAMTWSDDNRNRESTFWFGQIYRVFQLLFI